jgi:hypothetical protein
MSMISPTGTQWIWMSWRVVMWRDAAAVAIGHVGQHVDCSAVRCPGQLDALHVARVVQLVVQPVRQPDVTGRLGIGRG